MTCLCEGYRRALQIGVAAMVVCVLACGCSSGPRSTRLQEDDFVAITDAMAESLATSDFLKGRTSHSPEIVLTLQKILNLSTDLIPEGERWYLIERVFDSVPIQTLRRDKNIRVIRPADHVKAGKDKGLFIQTGDVVAMPTHVLTATFRTITRSGGNSRTEVYGCQYEIVQLTTGDVVWSEMFEFKRQAFGRSWD